MRYAITLTFQSGGMLQLPILPEKLKVSSPGKNKTATVLGIGEVLLLRLKGLRSVSWDSFFRLQCSVCDREYHYPGGGRASYPKRKRQP